MGGIALPMLGVPPDMDGIALPMLGAPPGLDGIALPIQGVPPGMAGPPFQADRKTGGHPSQIMDRKMGLPLSVYLHSGKGRAPPGLPGIGDAPWVQERDPFVVF